MKTFTLNGVTIVAKAIDYNGFCEMSENGGSLDAIDTKPFVVLRSYIAYCMDSDAETAGNLINDHIIAGFGLEDALNALADAVKNSGFIKALMATTQETPKKTTKAKATKAKPTENENE